MKRKPARSKKHASVPLTRQERALLDQSLAARLTPVDYSAETVHLERIRDLELRLKLYERSNWPVPVYNYAQQVKLIPLDYMKARIIELHMLGQNESVEYEVRYFFEGKEHRCRVFEDELEPC